MNFDCLEARRLAENIAMKCVLIIKIALNFVAAAGITAVVRTCRKNKLFVMHKNIRILLYFHFYYVIHVAVFMTLGLVIDFVRLSLNHKKDCDYLLPIWLTFPIKTSYMFGVFSETITIVYISLERFVATYYKNYEKVQCRFSIPAALLIQIIFAAFICYVLLGFGVDWSSQVVVFTFRTHANENIYEWVKYAMMVAEVCSIVLYHFILYVNHRDTKALHLTKSRESQLVKTLSEKYQMEENTKVIRLVLPIVWSHFIFVIIWGICHTLHAKLGGSITNSFFAIYVEATTTNVYYAITMSIIFLVLHARTRHKRSTAEVLKTGTYSTAEEYHKQLQTIFTTRPERPGNPSKK